MNTIEQLIDALANSLRGQVFLVNLHHTIERGLVSAQKIKAACNKFLLPLSVGGFVLPSSIDLTDRLGDTFVAQGLWLDAPEPILERHLPKNQFTLTRVTSYGGFFYSIINRKKGMPLIKELPEPLDLISGTNDEIDSRYVGSVRSLVNSGKWKDLITGNSLKFDTQCVWLAPLPKLARKGKGTKRKELADFHRDILGLSHFQKGRHIIRIDFDIDDLVIFQKNSRRRPHGAGNGGIRFRLNYDGAEAKCNWGRTVDLMRVKKRKANTLNGIPELLIEGFVVPKDIVTATYIGSLQSQPEKDDAYFISRLLKSNSMLEITTKLKEVLA